MSASVGLSVAQQFRADINQDLNRVIAASRADRQRVTDLDEYLIGAAQAFNAKRMSKPELANLLAAAIDRLIEIEGEQQ